MAAWVGSLFTHMTMRKLKVWSKNRATHTRLRRALARHRLLPILKNSVSRYGSDILRLTRILLLFSLQKGDINQLLPIDRHDELKMMEALTTGPVTASICATCPAFKAYKSGVLTGRKLLTIFSYPSSRISLR